MYYTLLNMFNSNIKEFFRRIKYELKGKNSIFLDKVEDSFYEFHQNRLRGNEKLIKQKQQIYIPFIGKINKSILKQYEFLDCGFGRGEFLEILRDLHIPKILGVDTNKNFITLSKDKNFNVVEDDAIRYLYVHEKKYSGISAFHLIEHLTFNELFDFLLICQKKIAKGGVLILETPNIENVIVSTKTFYYDPTHIQKLPRIFLLTLLEFFGFKDITFLPIHPSKEQNNTEIDNILFGPQDMGVVAYVK